MGSQVFLILRRGDRRRNKAPLKGRPRNVPAERSFCYAVGMEGQRTQRTQLIEQLGSVFQQQGYDGATLARLAAVTGLGKASLYHHFPGGKEEMAQVLVRHAVANLEQGAFSRLQGRGDPRRRLLDFVDGFCAYAEQGRANCLLAVLVQGSARPLFADQISAQLRDWQSMLAGVFEELGEKPKRAHRSAGQLLDTLHGSLIMARLLNDPRHFQQAAKRLRKRL